MNVVQLFPLKQNLYLYGIELIFVIKILKSQLF